MAIGDYGVTTVTIAQSGTVSSAGDLEGRHLVGIGMPAGWDAASLSFQVARSGETTFRALYRDGSLYSRSDAAADRDLGIDPAVFAGVTSVKLVASASQTTAARTITLYTRRYS